MKFSSRRALSGLVTLALCGLIALPLSAAETYIKADPSNWGVEGYEVTPQGDGSTIVKVVSSPENAAKITLKSSEHGMVADIVMDRSGESLQLQASSDGSGQYLQGGKVVAAYSTAADGECKQEGFEQLEDSTAFVVLAKSLQDSQLTATTSSSASSARVIIPILRCGVALVRWCTRQCNCCTAFYSTVPPPAAGTPEPACCGHCFSWYCGDF